ncbi:MAG TPA: hypothetical protein VIN65_10675 [Candidatus Dormibacteraeota bacterium]
MTDTTATSILIRPELVTHLTRRWCHLCDEMISKVEIVSFLNDEDGDEHPVCDDCAFLSPDALRQRILVTADREQSESAHDAAWHRSIASCVVPADRGEYDRLEAEQAAYWAEQMAAAGYVPHAPRPGTADELPF